MSFDAQQDHLGRVSACVTGRSVDLATSAHRIALYLDGKTTVLFQSKGGVKSNGKAYHSHYYCLESEA